MPEGISVDHHIDPLCFSDRLGGDLNQAVFGDRTKSAMHLRTEAHFHTLDDWLEVEPVATSTWSRSALRSPGTCVMT